MVLTALEEASCHRFKASCLATKRAETRWMVDLGTIAATANPAAHFVLRVFLIVS
jgi:hypothetical protein